MKNLYTTKTKALIVVTILICLILPLGLLPVSCAKVKLDDSTREEGLLAEIPFQLYGSMIITEISVDESGPLNFIFDTGAGGTVISTRTAARLGIVGDETVSREGGIGMAEIVRSTNHIVDAGDLGFQDVTLGIAELDHIERRLGIRIDGIIGWEILSNYAVRLDYDAMRIEIYDNKRFDYDLGMAAYKLDVQGTVLFTNVTVAFGSSDIFNGRVLVDTGFGGCISFNTPFAAEHDVLANMGDYYEKETQSLSSVGSITYSAILTSLSIGDYKFAAVPANVATAESGAVSWKGIMGILGNDILKRSNIFIDVQQQTMFLEPNHLYNESFEINCSGLELLSDDTFQKVIVDRVYEGSPAAEAGLMVGDETLQIDGGNVSNLQLPHIRSMLSKNGSQVEIVVAREGELHCYLFRLQPLISYPRTTGQ